ncbi:MAG: Hpt domain-containing protein, partial [Oscillospiraceae bacterium]
MAKFEAGMESMVDMYIFETTSLLEQLDQILMKTESEHSFSTEEINEIFRTMHTIKGSSAMMGLDNMSKLAHSIEDMFYIIREENPVISDMNTLYDILFSASDLLKAEIELIQEEEYTASDFTPAMDKIKTFAAALKGGTPAPASAPDAQTAAPVQASAAAPAVSAAAASSDSELTTVKVMFDDDCKMENLRALLVVNKIAEDCEKLEYIPADIETNSESAKEIIENGFIIKFKPSSDMDIDSVVSLIGECTNVKSYEITERGRSVELVGKINVKVTFEEECKMENLRALIVINNIKENCKSLSYEPSDIEENSAAAQTIIDNGFMIHFEANDPKGVIRSINGSPNVKCCEILSSDSTPASSVSAPAAQASAPSQAAAPSSSAAAQSEKKSVEQINNMLGNKGAGAKQSLISVNLNKLDTLLDLVGEIVITEAMVTSNPDLKGLRLDNFQKSARQLRKLNSELQDTVMSIRMVPISGAFNKMTRIV